jgi:ATP-dependent DNA ligase
MIVADYTIPKAVDYKNMSAKAKALVDFSSFTPQVKYDGCAVRIDTQNGGRYSVMSATGEPVRSLERQAKDIAQRLTVFPGAVICAEAWLENTPQQTISGDFRRHSQSDLKLIVFDGYINDHEGAMDKPYHQRFGRLAQHLGMVCSFAHTQPKVSTLEEAECAARLVARGTGYDGIVLRNFNAPFEAGRSKGNIIKVKPLLTYDLEVIGVEEGVGEKTKRPTVALLCRWQYGTQKVATGLSHAQQADPFQFVGKIIEVQGMGLTADGKLREPRFRGLRTDKLQPDF